MSPFWRRSREAPAALPFHSFHSAATSRTGTRRVNQDAVGKAESEGLVLHVLADGLGGHARGDEAARLTVERCVSGFRDRPSMEPGALEALVQEAHRALVLASGSGPGPPSSRATELRSTVVLLALDGVRALWAHVGDSRLYHFRGGRIRDRTRDHSVPEMLLRAGEIREEEIRGHADRNRLLRALGQEATLRVDVAPAVELEEGDAFLLCSDGWWEIVRDDEMERALTGEGDSAAWLEAMEVRIEAASRSSQDNYTAVAVTVGGVP